MKTILRRMALAGYLIALATMATAADLHVPAEHSTIQAAVDAASNGDTINIAAGVYVEQTRILRKNLTLIGQPGTILRAFTNMELAMPGNIDWKCVLFVFKSPHVAIQGLTFEGDQLASEQGGFRFLGASFVDSGGSVEQCRFTGFRERVPESTIATAVRFFNCLPGAPLLEASVVGNTISDCYTGIRMVGATNVTSLNINIAGNTITGVGTNSPEAEMHGVALGAGVTGKITGNTISNFSYVGEEGSYAYGIVGYDLNLSSNHLAPVTIEGNVLRNNQGHVALFLSDDSVITKNTLEGNLRGLRLTGIWFTGENVEVSENQFRDLESGIRVGGDDGPPPGIGTAGGFATNAVLTNNRFCDVTTPVEMQPGATATETGTLTCPFPDPDLKIAKAVLLSWPWFELGFAVESAPTADGPWNPSGVTPLVQESQHRATVPTSADKQFFRLKKP